MRISRSERAWTSSAAVEADDIVRLAQLALVPVDVFSSPVSALNTLYTCSKEKKTAISVRFLQNLRTCSHGTAEHAWKTVKV